MAQQDTGYGSFRVNRGYKKPDTPKDEGSDKPKKPKRVRLSSYTSPGGERTVTKTAKKGPRKPRQLRSSVSVSSYTSPRGGSVDRSYTGEKSSSSTKRPSWKATPLRNAAQRRAYRIKEHAYKGSYYGPDEFKGSEKAQRAWRKAGSPTSHAEKAKIARRAGVSPEGR